MMIAHFNVNPEDPFGGKPPFWSAAGGQPRSSSKKLRVIVVDDEVLIAESLADILSGEGCESMAVSDGATAIELARKIRPDVVITDVVMPGISGIEAAESIREFLPECRIVLFSGQAFTNELLVNARARGHSFELLNKPVRPTTLITLLGLNRGQ